MKFCLLFALLNILSITQGSPIDLSKSPMENAGLFEGDIAGIDSKGVAQIPTSQYAKWPGGIIPYIIDDFTYNSTQLATIMSGMRLLEDQTRVNGRDCIKFVQRTNENTYLRIHNGQGCWSYVGRQNKAGAQLVSLMKPSATSRSSCLYKGIVAHELMHALGFWHEQSRADRDNYVRIAWENIATDQQHNFNKYTTSADTQGLPYDYYSIMHYESTAFSTNGQPTVIALQSGVNLVNASQKQAITNTDVAEIRKYYNCS